MTTNILDISPQTSFFFYLSLNIFYTPTCKWNGVVCFQVRKTAANDSDANLTYFYYSIFVFIYIRIINNTLNIKEMTIVQENNFVRYRNKLFWFSFILICYTIIT